MTAWIWEGVPAVMLERVQVASFWMDFLAWVRRFSKWGRMPESMTFWVCSSVPVTMLPMAGVSYFYADARIISRLR